MNQFGGILGNVVGSVFGNHPRWARDNSLGETLGELSGGVPFRSGMLLSAALRLIQRSGGLDGLLARLHQNGFSAQADSWVGTGPNLPITAAELDQALGVEVIDSATAPLGLLPPTDGLLPTVGLLPTAAGLFPAGGALFAAALFPPATLPGGWGR